MDSASFAKAELSDLVDQKMDEDRPIVGVFEFLDNRGREAPQAFGSTARSAGD